MGIGVGGGYVAITGNFENLIYPLILCFFVMFWVAGFDIIYAIQDVKFDRKQNLYSVPAKFGVKNGLRISLLFHLVSIGILILFYVLFQSLFSSAFMFGLGIIIIIIIIIALLLIYEHKICYSDVSEAAIQKAFFTTNAVVGVCFLVFLILGLYFKLI